MGAKGLQTRFGEVFNQLESNGFENAGPILFESAGWDERASDKGSPLSDTIIPSTPGKLVSASPKPHPLPVPVGTHVFNIDYGKCKRSPRIFKLDATAAAVPP